MTEPRLPPGQRWVDRLIVYDVAAVPPVDPQQVSLRLFGDVDRPIDLSLIAFSRLPQVEATCDLHCVTRWSVRDVHFAGVSTRTILDLVRPTASVTWVIAHGREGYRTNVPSDHFAREETLLALEMNGEPLAAEHGAPLRLVVPSLYLWKSAKYLSALEFTSAMRRGTWEEAGYHDVGDPWREERFRR